MSAAVTEPLVSPYKGLANYTEQDADLFFGRDRERKVIIANLKARKLTLLYGESGVGKSSLLRAGVMADLLADARENVDDIGVPEHIPVIFSEWRDDPVPLLAAAIRDAADAFTDSAGDPPDDASLSELISWAAAELDSEVLIILDQFEEYFLYHPEPDEFAAEFVEIVNGPLTPANFLVSMREDTLAKLDRFRRDIPRLYDSALRVNHLDIAAAREAIQRPIDRYNAVAADDERVDIEPALVTAVIDGVRRGRVVLEQSGQGTLDRGDDAGDVDRIETPYLQLVMSRVWDVEESKASPALRHSTLLALGGAAEIVRTHLDAALSGLDAGERDTAAELFHHLVTPSGSKIALAVPDLAEYAERPRAEVHHLLEKLARADTRILRPVPPPPGEEGPPRYEIFHDVLAPSVLAWRTRHTTARRAEQQRRASRAALLRRFRRVVFGLAVFGTAALAAVIVLGAQRNEARRLAEEARKQELSARLYAQQATEARNAAEGLTQGLRKANGRLRSSNANERRLAAANRATAAEARTLAADNARRATEAQALAQENRRQATRAQTLATQNRRSAERARRLAREARRQAERARNAAARASRLADANRRRAEDLRKLSTKLENMLSLVPDTFSPRYTYTWRRTGSVTRFSSLGVIAPPKATVTATCDRGQCPPFKGSAPDPAGVLPITTIANRPLRFPTTVVLTIETADQRTTYTITTRRDEGPHTERTTCRPPGSKLPDAIPACN